MAKPASGATLDSGGSLYSALTAAGSAVWAMLEGSGSTSADSSGNGHTLTKDSSVSWTTIAGEAALAFAGSTGQAAAVSSSISVSGASSWSFAWRAKQTSGGTLGIYAGKDSGSVAFLGSFAGLYIWLRSANTTDYLFADTDFTTDHDWLMVYDQPAARLHLYKDGTETAASPLTISGNDAAWVIASLGSGNDGAGTWSLVGTMTYAYLMAGYAATGTDASNLHSNPYSIFSSGGGGSVVPQASYYNLLLRA